MPDLTERVKAIQKEQDKPKRRPAPVVEETTTVTTKKRVIMPRKPRAKKATAPKAETPKAPKAPKTTKPTAKKTKKARKINWKAVEEHALFFLWAFDSVLLAIVLLQLIATLA